MAEVSGLDLSGLKKQQEEQNRPAQQTQSDAPPPGGYQFNIDPITQVGAGYQNYLNPQSPGQILFPLNNPNLASAQLGGLELGKALTGQTVQQSGQQIQDLLQRQLGLLGADNPITGLMTQQKNAQIAQTGANMAKSGVRGGAAQAAKLQTGRAMDKQIAGQAYQQYQKNLGEARKFVGGIQRQQVSPMYTQMQMEMANQNPEFKGTAGGGLLSGLFEGLFG